MTSVETLKSTIYRLYNMFFGVNLLHEKVDRVGAV